jgi:hypothetical protein
MQVFVNREPGHCVSASLANRSRSALAMTLTDDSDMASAAITGDSNKPVIG